MEETGDLVKEFLVESFEALDQLDRDLVTLEQHPRDRELLARIFRSIHTIKGTCGFFGFSNLGGICHVGESLLSLLRDGTLVLDSERTSALLKLIDAIRQILSRIESTGVEGEGNCSGLISLLTRLQEDPLADRAPSAEVPRAMKNMGDLLIDKGVVRPEQVEKAAELQRRGDPRHIGEILIQTAAVPPSAVVEALATQGENTRAGDTTIRVDVGLLDNLMNSVVELALVRDEILRYAASRNEATFLKTTQRLDLIANELQSSVLKTRMQPIGNVWGKFPRVVRDLALACRKQVRIEVDGKDTKLDKSIIEAIKDPLMHIVRNSVDHGIELPAVRVAMGKPEEGVLFMRAYDEGGHVNIEITDDGAGIDPSQLRAKAVATRLFTADQAGGLSEREVLRLIFAPGFTTAANVTNMSGRGVGLDVVKTSVERVGGTVDVHSVPGRGTMLRIKVQNGLLGTKDTLAPARARAGRGFLEN